MATDLRIDQREHALLTDFYELTMAAAFFAHGHNDTACFSLTVRRMPARRGFLVAAGVERFLEVLEEYRFEEPALNYLRSLDLFRADFLDFLANLRFTGEVRAMPEGTVFFPDEPLIEVRAPLIEAQLLEPLAMNQIGFASLVASKAARVVAVAQGRRLIEFGFRRSQGVDAGLIAARASYLAGFAGSSNMLAGMRYGIPLYGTMAHSFVMAYEREREAFENYVSVFPRLSTLLVDTYDTLRGVENAAAVALRLKQAGGRLQGVRLDSGDFVELSKKARRILDERGLGEVPIFASGNLDEYRVEQMLGANAPIDAFGVGTALDVSDDAPALDVTYKLVEYRGAARLKLSRDKQSLPGRKQVFRALDERGRCYADRIGLAEESAVTVAREIRPAPASVAPLLEVQFRDGRRVLPRPTLEESRERFLAGFGKLDARYKDLVRPELYPVRPTAALHALFVTEKLKAEGRQD